MSSTGRNLATNSKAMDRRPEATTRDVAGYNGNEQLVVREDGFTEVVTNGTWRGIGMYLNETLPQVGESYTFSANVRNDSDIAQGVSIFMMSLKGGTRVYPPFSAYWHDTTGGKPSIPPGGEKRIAYTFTWSQEAIDLLADGGNIRCTMQVSNSEPRAFWAPKLEYGTTATPWRPAPEDTEQPSDLVYASEGVDLGDTSGDKLIANINLAGDTAKISAAHVEVTGEAVFSAINNDTGTTKISGGKIDADTLHVEAANIDGTLAIGKVTGLQDTLDGKADDADVTAAISTAAADATSKANAAQAAAEATASADATAKANDAAKTATNYIKADEMGIRIASSNPDEATTYQHQTATDTEFIVEGESRLLISGDGQRIGKAYVEGATDNESHMELDYHSFQMINKDGIAYIHVSDLRDESGKAHIELGMQRTFSHHAIFDISDYANYTNVVVSVVNPLSGDITSQCEITVTGILQEPAFSVIIDVPNSISIHPSSGLYVYISLDTDAHYMPESAMAFTLGSRGKSASNRIGGGSVSFGRQNNSGGLFGFASGKLNYVSGECAASLGAQCSAIGKHSVAMNYGTNASSDRQTVLGAYNTPDVIGKYALIIGNGSGLNSTSNAFAVSWNGLADIAGRTAYPLFVYSTAPSEASLPITPCFVLATDDYGLWFYDGN